LLTDKQTNNDENITSLAEVMITGQGAVAVIFGWEGWRHTGHASQTISCFFTFSLKVSTDDFSIHEASWNTCLQSIFFS